MPQKRLNKWMALDGPFEIVCNLHPFHSSSAIIEIDHPNLDDVLILCGIKYYFFLILL